MMDSPEKKKPRSATIPRRGIALAAVIVVVLLAIWFWTSGDSEQSGGDTLFDARQGDLAISVLELGTIEALESQVIKSEVRGQTKILDIVEEGYRVTQEDVADGMILVSLDDADLQENLTQQEIEFQNAVASLTDAREQYEIQIKQNESDIKEAELLMRFARLDFEKFLGADLAARITGDLKLDEAEAKIIAANAAALGAISLPDPGDAMLTVGGEEPDDRIRLTPEIIDSLSRAMKEKGMDVTPEQMLQRAEKDENGLPLLSPRMRDRLGRMGLDVDTLIPMPVKPAPKAPAPGGEGAPGQPDVVAEEDDTEAIIGSRVDFSKYVSLDTLADGEAKQELRKLTDEKLVAEEELSINKNTLEGTRKLVERDFETQNVLQTDEMKVTRSEIGLESATTALDLYIRYEFPKQCEKLLSDYEEALRKLERTQKQAVSKLAQEQAKLRSAEASYGLKRQRRDELIQQVAKCQIKAERPGLVVYGGSNSNRRYGSNEVVEPGAAVREMQEIITIPDTTKMGARVNIHESVIKKIKVGQKARVTVEAFPDEVLMAEVVKVGVLPDSSNRWLNPDMKVYSTTMSIDGVYEWLRPGMSANIEILVDSLTNVVYVPIQAVMASSEGRVVYVETAAGPVPKQVVTGEFNNEFIEVKSGLEKGERVYLRRPEQFKEEDAIVVEEESDNVGQQPPADSGSGGRSQGNGPAA